MIEKLLPSIAAARPLDFPTTTDERRRVGLSTETIEMVASLIPPTAGVSTMVAF